ncbi:hypothetical protein DJ521_06650, partial [Sulfolobus sp. E3]
RKLGIKGDETVNIYGLKDLTPKKEVTIEFIRDNGEKIAIKGLVRVDNNAELSYVKEGGILNYVLKRFLEHDEKS